MLRQFVPVLVVAACVGCRTPAPTFDPFHSRVAPPPTGVIQHGTPDPYYPPATTVPGGSVPYVPPAPGSFTAPNIQIPQPAPGPYPQGGATNNTLWNRRADAEPATSPFAPPVVSSGQAPTEPQYPVQPASYAEASIPPSFRGGAPSSTGTEIRIVPPTVSAPGSEPVTTAGWTSTGRSTNRVEPASDVQSIDDLPPANWSSRRP